jgi:hypothetical protein
MAQMTSYGLATVLRLVDERRWLRHGLFWLVDTGLMVEMFLHGFTTDVHLARRNALLVLVPHLLATYPLLYGVVPVLWQPNRQLRFWLLLAGWFALSLVMLVTYRILVFVPLHRGVATTFHDFHVALTMGPYVLLLCTAGVATCLRLYRQRWHQELTNAQLAQENHQAELQLLKAQIHPHFLFNTLNNLYALTLKQSSQAPEVVERLTGLLQFVVEQGNAPLVTLADEVALLGNYLALEQLRYGQRLTLQLEADGLPATGRIAPLLLLPLVENAFKHGSAEQLGQAHIRIVLAVERNEFRCVIINSRSPTPTPKASPDGIGLRNVRQRLHLLYPQRHHLETEAGPDTFTVRLTLQLTTPLASSPAEQAAVARRSPPLMQPKAALPSQWARLHS